MSSLANEASDDDAQGEVTLLNVSMKLLEERSTLLQSLETNVLPTITKLMSTNERLVEDLLPIQTWIIDHLKHGRVELPGSSVNDTRLTGWLEKKGGAIGTKWQRRWCKLWGQELSYYADDNGLRLKGQLDLNACTCEAIGHDKDGRYLFEITAGQNKTVKKSSGMRFQTSEKTRYRFRAKDENDLNLWVNAIKHVTFHPDINRGVSFRKLFLDFENSKYQSMGRKLAYLNAIREISVASHHTPVVVPCDWLHQQMIKQSRTKTIERGQEEHEHLGENRDVAKSMDQVYKDLKRDKLILNGEEFTCPDGNNILNILYHSIMENRDIKSSLEVTPSTTGHAQDARDAIAFARTILLGSVRTVCGGEAYDAVTFMFHDTDFVMICPDATQTYPLKLTVNRRNSLDEEGSFFERSSKAFGLLNLRSRKSGGPSTSDLKSSLKKCNSVNSMTRNGRKSHYSQLHEKWTTSPKRSKGLNGKTSQSSPNILKGGSGLSTHREQIQNKEAQGTIWPEVTIEAESTFKIMALDPEDDVDMEPYAFVKATFKRTFVWGRHTYLKPACVMLVVEDNVNKDDIQEKLRAKNHNSWSQNMPGGMH